MFFVILEEYERQYIRECLRRVEKILLEFEEYFDDHNSWLYESSRGVSIAMPLYREYSDYHSDSSQKQYTRRSSAESESSILDRLWEIVSEWCPKRTSQDIGEPKTENSVYFYYIVCSCDHCDDTSEYQGRCEISEWESLSKEITRCSPEGKGKQDSDPIKNFPFSCIYSMNRECSLPGIP